MAYLHSVGHVYLHKL